MNLDPLKTLLTSYHNMAGHTGPVDECRSPLCRESADTLARLSRGGLPPVPEVVRRGPIVRSESPEDVE